MSRAEFEKALQERIANCKPNKTFPMEFTVIGVIKQKDNPYDEIWLYMNKDREFITVNNYMPEICYKAERFDILMTLMPDTEDDDLYIE